MTEGSCFDSKQEQNIFFLNKASKPSLENIQPPIRWLAAHLQLTSTEQGGRLQTARSTQFSLEASWGGASLTKGQFDLFHLHVSISGCRTLNGTMIRVRNYVEGSSCVLIWSIIQALAYMDWEETTKNLRIVFVTIKIRSGYLVDRIVKRYQLWPSCSVKDRRSKIRHGKWEDEELTGKEG